MEEKTLQLDPDDFLLLYTDGLTEAFSPEGELYGEERLCEVVRSSPAVAARTVLDGIERSVDQFMGSIPAADDMTMLAVRRSA
jgi:serine phosphatase RsbU (regulator of sigma subunit)